MYPAATPGVVGVGAIDKGGKTTAESQRGPQVDLAAPGEDIYAACTGGTQVCVSHGTSDATALASASAALIWSKHPDWTNNQVLRVLINTAGKAKSGKDRTASLATASSGLVSLSRPPATPAPPTSTRCRTLRLPPPSRLPRKLPRLPVAVRATRASLLPPFRPRPRRTARPVSGSPWVSALPS